MGKGALPKKKAAKGRPLRSDSLPRGMPAVALGKASRSAKLKVLAKNVKKPLKPAVKSKTKSVTIESNTTFIKGRKNVSQDSESSSSRSPTEPASKRVRAKGVTDRSESPSTTRLSRSSSSSSIAPKPTGSKKAANAKAISPVNKRPKVSNANIGIMKFFPVRKESEFPKVVNKKQSKKDPELLSVQNAAGGSKQDTSVDNSSSNRLDINNSQPKNETCGVSTESVKISKPSSMNNHEDEGENEEDDENNDRLSSSGILSEDLDINVGQDAISDQISLDHCSSKLGKKSGKLNSGSEVTLPKLLPELTKKNINQLFPMEDFGGKRLRSGSPASQKSTRSVKVYSRVKGGLGSRYPTRSDSAIRILRNGKQSKIESVQRKKGPPALLKLDDEKMEDSRSDFSDEQSSIFSESDSSSFVDTPTRLKNCELEDKLDSEEAQGSISNDEDVPVERVDSPMPAHVKSKPNIRPEGLVSAETSEQSGLIQENCSSTSPTATVKENLKPDQPIARTNTFINDIHTDWDSDGEDNKHDSSKLSKHSLSPCDDLMLNVASMEEKEKDVSAKPKPSQCIPDDMKVEESCEKSDSPPPSIEESTKPSSNTSPSEASNGQSKLPEPIVIATSDKNGFAESVDFVAKKNPRIDFELLRRRTKRSMSFNVDPHEKANQNHRILAVEPPKPAETPQLVWTVKAVREPIIPKLKKSVGLKPASPVAKGSTESLMKDYESSSSKSLSEVELPDSQSSLSNSSLKENMKVQPQSKQTCDGSLREVSKASSVLSPSKSCSDSALEATARPASECAVSPASGTEGSPSSTPKTNLYGPPMANAAVASCADSSLATAAKTPINESNINEDPVVPSPVREQDTEADAAAEERCVTPLNYQPVYKRVEKTPESLNFDDGESFCLRLSPTPTKDDQALLDQSTSSVDTSLNCETKEESKIVKPNTSDVSLVENCDMNRNMEKPLSSPESDCAHLNKFQEAPQNIETVPSPGESNQIVVSTLEDDKRATDVTNKPEEVNTSERGSDKAEAAVTESAESTVSAGQKEKAVSLPTEDLDGDGGISALGDIVESSTSADDRVKCSLSTEKEVESISPSNDKSILTTESNEDKVELSTASLVCDEVPKEIYQKPVFFPAKKRGRPPGRSRCAQRSRSLGSFEPPLSLVINLRNAVVTKSVSEKESSGHQINESRDNLDVNMTGQMNGESNDIVTVNTSTLSQSVNSEKIQVDSAMKKRRSSEGSLSTAHHNEANNEILTMTVECVDSSVKQPGLLSPRLEADVERHHLELNKSNIERKRREITEEEQSPEKRAIKEWILSSLGLQSVAAAAAASDVKRPAKRRSQDGIAPSSGRLKTVIKVPRDSKKDKKGERKPLRMVFKNGKPYPGGFEDKPLVEKGMEVDSALRCEGHSSHDVPSASGGSDYGLNNVSLLPDTSALIPGPDTDGKSKPVANLVIPEKSSSFSIHPGRLCSDVCSYCFGKFGSLDTPCHVAQLKSRERQMKIMSVETHLAMDSCLCDACIRYVDRKANCPSAKPQPTQKKENKSRFEGSMSTCSVTGCIQPARHSIRKKWYIKIRKSVLKKCPIDLELAHQHLPLPLCPEHFSYMEYFMVCGLCKRRLSRSHMYNLTNTREINFCLEYDGIPARLSDRLFVCKLCRYYATLRVKHPRGNFTLSANQREFFNSYRKRILRNHDMEVSESEESTADPNPVEQTASEEPTAATEENLPRGKRRRSKSNATSPVEPEDTEPVKKKPRSSDHNTKTKEKETAGSHHVPGELVTTLPVVHSKSSKSNKSSKSKTSATEVDHASAAEWIRKGLPPFYPGENELALHANFQFQYKDSPSESRAWEKCTSLLQFDRETKKLWQELQRPYGSQSSFLRHLVLMERYWRQGELVLSPTATARATSYTRSVQNRLRAYGSTFTNKTSPECSNSVTTVPAPSPPVSTAAPLARPALVVPPTSATAAAPVLATTPEVAKALSGGTVLTAAAAAAAVTAVHTHSPSSVSPTSTALGPPASQPAHQAKMAKTPAIKASAKPAGKQQGKQQVRPQVAQAPHQEAVKASPQKTPLVLPQPALKPAPSQENATLRHQLSQPALTPVPVLNISSVPTNPPVSISSVPRAIPVQIRPQSVQLKPKPLASLCRPAVGPVKAKALSSGRVTASTWEPAPLPAASRPQFTTAPVVNLTRSISLTAVPSSPPSVPDLHPINSETRPNRSPSSISNSTSISVTSSGGRGATSGGFVSILPASTTLSTFPKLSSQTLSKPASITPIYTSQSLPSSVSVTSSVSSAACVNAPVAMRIDPKTSASTGKVHVTAGGKSFSLTIQQFKKLQALRQQRQLEQRKKGLGPKLEENSNATTSISKSHKDDLEVVEVKDGDTEAHQSFIPTISAVCSGDQAKAMWDEGSRQTENDAARAASPPVVEITPIVENPPHLSVEKLPKIPKALTVTQIRGDSPSKTTPVTSQGMSVTITRQACQTPVPIHVASHALDIFPN